MTHGRGNESSGRGVQNHREAWYREQETDRKGQSVRVKK